MNEIKSVVRETIELVEEIKQNSQQLSSDIEKYDEQVAEQRLGAKQAQEMAQEGKNKLSEETQSKANALLDRLNAQETRVLEHIEKDKDPVTSDNVAELQLLAQIETTTEELEKYAGKYKNNDLALRMLSKIAREQDLIINLPESAESKIEQEYSQLRGIINNYTRFTADTELNRMGRNNMLFNIQLETLNSLK